MPFKKGITPPGAKPFVKGKSGNPNGKPKKIPHLQELLAEVLSDEKDGIPAAKAILMALRSKATKGDVRAAEVLLDRAYGRAKQSIEHSGNMVVNTSSLSPDDLLALANIQKKTST